MPTTKQIAALKYMIFKAKDGNELSKRILAFLLDQSKGLTKEVRLTLVADREGYTGGEIQAAAYGIGVMESCNCTTHVDQLLHVTGSEFLLSFCCGAFDANGADELSGKTGQCVGFNSPRRESVNLGYTFWLAKELCSQQATLITTTRDELERIDLSRPGLYKHETT